MSRKDTVGLDSTVVQIEELAATELDGETVMMSVENGKYYGLDDIGSFIWSRIQQPRRVSDVCEQLLQEFEVEREQCQRDVLAFLNKLAEEKIVRVVDGPDR